MDAYDRWKTSPPEPKVVGSCEHCAEEISEGEEAYVVEDVLVHEGQCWTDYSVAALDAQLVKVSGPRR
jgi:hypothetical protein